MKTKVHEILFIAFNTKCADLNQYVCMWVHTKIFSNRLIINNKSLKSIEFLIEININQSPNNYVWLMMKNAFLLNHKSTEDIHIGVSFSILKKLDSHESYKKKTFIFEQHQLA